MQEKAGGAVGALGVCGAAGGTDEAVGLCCAEWKTGEVVGGLDVTEDAGEAGMSCTGVSCFASDEASGEDSGALAVAFPQQIQNVQSSGISFPQ